MASTSVLFKPWFWILFVATVIVALYFYGLSILGDRTEIAQTKKALILANEELTKCNQDITTKLVKIIELQNSIKQLNIQITQNNNLISQLNDSIYILANRPPEIEYKYNTVYKEKPEPYHQFGKGNGKLTLFKTCNCYNLKFWIDGEYVGSTGSIFNSGDPSCSANGTVSKVVLAGKHHIEGKDEENHSWDFYVTVFEDQCLVKGVK
jgi:hypothetical protein